MVWEKEEMNWEIFMEIVEDYKSKGKIDKTIEFMRRWNVI